MEEKQVRFHPELAHAALRLEETKDNSPKASSSFNKQHGASLQAAFVKPGCLSSTSFASYETFVVFLFLDGPFPFLEKFHSILRVFTMTWLLSKHDVSLCGSIDGCSRHKVEVLFGTASSAFLWRTGPKPLDQLAGIPHWWKLSGAAST